MIIKNRNRTKDGQLLKRSREAYRTDQHVNRYVHREFALKTRGGDVSAAKLLFFFHRSFRFSNHSLGFHTR